MAKHHSSQSISIPTEFARDPDLTARAARVYLYLASHPEGSRMPAMSIAKDLGMGRGTVTRALDDLERSGYIQRDNKIHGADTNG